MFVGVNERERERERERESLKLLDEFPENSEATASERQRGVVNSLVTSLMSVTQCVVSSLPRVRSLATLFPGPLVRPRYGTALPLEEN